MRSANIGRNVGHRRVVTFELELIGWVHVDLKGS